MHTVTVTATAAATTAFVPRHLLHFVARRDSQPCFARQQLPCMPVIVHRRDRKRKAKKMEDGRSST